VCCVQQHGNTHERRIIMDELRDAILALLHEDIDMIGEPV
jgi:hypothetical protein